jgi:disulfide bond formation protein DsbB
MQKADKPCDEVNWSLFGISMATYNVFFSSALGLISIVASKKMAAELKGRVIQ